MRIAEPGHLDAAAGASPGFADDVRHGLSARPKRLSCTYLYDDEGARLFDQICALPEYYLTRAEREILAERADAIAGRFDEAVALVELGSGSATKTTLLIDALLSRHGRLRYLPIDVSRATLVESSGRLSASRPRLDVYPIPAEYRVGLALAHALEHDRPKLLLWLGSSIGNLDRAEAAAFLQSIRGTVGAADRLLIGIDLRKDRDVLERAYNDQRGVTARFNLNLLQRINRELGGRFDVRRFRHLAELDEDTGCIRMLLIAREPHRVAIDALALEVDFAGEEPIHTESCYKYDPHEIDALAQAAGFSVEERWLDRLRRFSLNLLAPVRH